MSIEADNVIEEIAPEQIPPEEPPSRQDQFFGVETVIGKETVSPPPEKQPPAEVDETITFKNADELDEEMKKYAKKRINELTYERHEAQRQQQAAEKLRDEAVQFTQAQVQRNQQLENIINTGEAHLVGQFKKSAELAVDQAKEKHRKAYDDGDTEKVISALEDMVKTQQGLKDAFTYEAGYNQRAQQFAARQQMPQQQMPQQQVMPQRPPPTEQTLAWTRENPWFQNKAHEDMTAIVDVLHKQAIRDKGLTPDTKEYFDDIDQGMRSRFPSYFKQAPSTPVAPSTRTSQARPRRTKLTESEKRIARKSGLTDEQYDLEKKKIEQAR